MSSTAVDPSSATSADDAAHRTRVADITHRMLTEPQSIAAHRATLDILTELIASSADPSIALTEAMDDAGNALVIGAQAIIQARYDRGLPMPDGPDDMPSR